MKNKILRYTCVLLLLLLVVAYVIFCGATYQENVTQVKTQLAEETAYLAAVSEELTEESLEKVSFSLGSDGRRVTIVAEDGTVLYDTGSDAEQMENHNERPEIVQAREEGTGEAERYSSTLQKKNFYYARLLPDGRIIRLSITTASVFSMLRNWFVLVLVLGCVLFILAVILANRLARRIVEPINSLDLKHPLQNQKAYDELSPLLLRLERQNRTIAQQMESLKARENEFTAITANMHEGLILLNGNLEVLSINDSAREILGVPENRQPDEEESAAAAAAAAAAAEEGVITEHPMTRNGMPVHILTLNRSQELLDTVKAAQAGETAAGILECQGRRYSVLANPVKAPEKAAGQGAEEDWSEDGAQDRKENGVVLFLLDVTRQVESEQMRREFSANVSHELKTPLTSISGYAELLENGMAKPEDVPVFAGRIRKESERLISLIEDIMQLSRLDENDGDWQKEAVELKTLCENIAQSLAGSAEERNITLSVTGEAASVVGVPHLLEEFFYNLCDNAVKYNKDGGAVHVKVEKEDGHAVVTVEDTGIGIGPEHQDRIFERFYRVDKSHSKETGGTGLGLSIVKHAAALHDARIDLKSREGVGTRITVTFPEAK